MTSLAVPASFRRTACSTAISQKGFMAIFTLAVSTPVLSAFTRPFTLASMTRLIGPRTFIAILRPSLVVEPVSLDLSKNPPPAIAQTLLAMSAGGGHMENPADNLAAAQYELAKHEKR